MTLAKPTDERRHESMADVLHRVGDVPPQRVRAHPPVGTASESDVIAIHDSENRLFELVDGILVEKAMGYREALLAVALASLLREFVRKHKLGRVTGAAGMMRLFPGLVRIPDVAFASWSRFPGGRLPAAAIPTLAPDLAVEILSESNTAAEITRKIADYFRAGTRLVWIIDPDARNVRVFIAADKEHLLDESDTLDGGDVLPGFTASLSEFFAELDEDGTN